MDKIFEVAMERFVANEADNIVAGVSERNLCGRLAMRLQEVANEKGLDKYYADVEYNRKQNGRIKTILDDQMQEVVINCDLILHSRGEIIARDNLIAVEMKKSNRPYAETVSDRTRLRAMTKASYDNVWSYDGVTHPEYVCGYELGAFIEVNAAKRNLRVEFFKGGKATHCCNYEF